VGRDGQRGQSTVEWVALLLLVALLLAGLLAISGARLPGAALADAIAGRIACALGLGGGCRAESALVDEYGPELAGFIAANAPRLVYEEGELELPVDFRDCRDVECSLGPESGEVSATNTGLPVTAFIHVIDCRPEASASTERAGGDCSGDRAGSLYLQYFFYYPDSSTLEELPGNAGYHPDDWESYGVRIGPGGTYARASSHHGYNYERSAANWGSDAGIGALKDFTETVGLRDRGGWGPTTSSLYVSAGSHAGNAADGGAGGAEPSRWTPGSSLVLVPIEPIADEHAGVEFAVTPPWLKDVYTDPEAEGT
jgi:hypothetical protein